MMKNTGGPVYPIVCDGDPCIILHSEGMTLRDYFAGHSHFGINQAIDLINGIGSRSDPASSANIDDIAETMAMLNYKYADAMIKERNK